MQCELNGCWLPMVTDALRTQCLLVTYGDRGNVNWCLVISGDAGLQREEAVGWL